VIPLVSKNEKRDYFLKDSEDMPVYALFNGIKNKGDE
jgi:hypothetical protein